MPPPVDPPPVNVPFANQDFELGAPNWSLSGPQMTIAVGEGRSGGTALKGVKPVAVGQISGETIASIPVTPGKVYILSVWVKTQGVFSPPGGPYAPRFGLQWYDAASVYIGGAFPLRVAPDGDVDWYNDLAISIALPANADHALVVCYMPDGTTGTVWWDDITLVEDDFPAFANYDFEYGSAEWTLSAGMSIASDQVFSGTKSLKGIGPGPITATTVSPIALKEGHVYRVTARVKTEGVTGTQPARISFAWYTALDVYVAGAFTYRDVAGDSGWFEDMVQSPPIPVGSTKGYAVCYMPTGATGTVWWDSLTVTEDHPPALQASNVEYRGRVRSGNVRVRLEEELNYLLDPLVPADLTIRVEVLATAVVDNRVGGTAGPYIVTLATAGLAAGTYTIRCTSRVTATGVILSQIDLPLDHLDTGTYTAYMDLYNHLVVNNQTVFPRIFYIGPGSEDPDYLVHLTDIANADYNMVLSYGILGTSLQQDTALATTFLNACQARGLGVMVDLRYAYHIWNSAHDAARLTAVNTLKTHPAVYGWYLNDEAPPVYEDRLITIYGAVAAADPDHPIWSLPSIGDLASINYNSTGDILGGFSYPLYDSPITEVNTAVVALAAAAARAAWFDVQVFDAVQYGGTGPGPSLKHEICMLYQALVRGVMGIGLWQYTNLLTDALTYAVRWADMVIVGDELRLLAPCLAPGEVLSPTLAVSVSGGTTTIIQRFDPETYKVYVLCVNTHAAQTATVTVTAPAGAIGYQRLYHGSLETLSSPVFSVPAEDGATLIISAAPVGESLVLDLASGAWTAYNARPVGPMIYASRAATPGVYAAHAQIASGNFRRLFRMGGESDEANVISHRWLSKEFSGNGRYLGIAEVRAVVRGVSATNTLTLALRTNGSSTDTVSQVITIPSTGEVVWRPPAIPNCTSYQVVISGNSSTAFFVVAVDVLTYDMGFD